MTHKHRHRWPDRGRQAGLLCTRSGQTMMNGEDDTRRRIDWITLAPTRVERYHDDVVVSYYTCDGLLVDVGECIDNCNTQQFTRGQRRRDAIWPWRLISVVWINGRFDLISTICRIDLTTPNTELYVLHCHAMSEHRTVEISGCTQGLISAETIYKT